jgi:hypothetical protein
MSSSPTELRLYVVSGTPNSDQALLRLNEALASQPSDRFRLEVVDIRGEPLRALLDGIVAIPTLQKQTGMQRTRLAGNFADREALVLFLGVADEPTATPGQVSWDSPSLGSATTQS